MDFFKHQDLARKRTKWLLLYFVLAVVAIVVSINMVTFVLLNVFGGAHMTVAQWLHSPWFVAIALISLAAIGIGSGARMVQLSAGGKAVADMVGARRILPETTDPLERRLINVVEEMSIASGTPLPRLYVMDNERAINAFVAGLKTQETVLVVTRGTLEKLNRSELQGVVGHEYSHILNGDMRINVRLIGILAGILLIGQCGEFILRSLRYVDSGSSRRSKKDGNAVLFILALGVALVVIGYVGLFFGRLIKSAISRQREFLADASSVQFTRDNSGIGNALAKIQLHSGQSLLNTPYAEDMSHLCFGQPIKLSFGGVFATHPPLNERIAALGFTPDVLLRSVGQKIKMEQTQAAADEARHVQPQTHETLQKMMGAAAVVATVGNVSESHWRYAQSLHNAIPEALLHAAHDRQSAAPLLMAMAIVESPSVEAIALMHVERKMGASSRAQLAQFLPACKQLPATQRLALLNAMRPALEFMTKTERATCINTLREIVKLDQAVTPFEYVLTSLAQSWLQPKSAYSGASIKRYTDVADELAIVIAMIVRAGRDNIDAAQARYQQAMKVFAVPVRTMATQFDADALHDALLKLDALLPMLKRPLLQTLADLILDDNEVTVDESELLRAIAEHLNCPLPPLLVNA